MISRQAFVQIMYALQKQEERDRIIANRLNDVMHESIPSIFTTQCVDPILQALKSDFNDESDWIDWWVWEKDFGRNQGITAYSDDEITEIPLNSAHQLYELLVKNDEENTGTTK